MNFMSEQLYKAGDCNFWDVQEETTTPHGGPTSAETMSFRAPPADQQPQLLLLLPNN